mgnify:CR=1 FL=1
MTLAILFALFAVLVAIEMPVAFAMGLSSIVTIAITQPIPLSIVVQRMGTGLDSFVLIAIPLFVLAGHLMNRAGIAERLVDEKGEVRRFVNVYVNEEDIRFLTGSQTPLKDGDEISIIPAIAGG